MGVAAGNDFVLKRSDLDVDVDVDVDVNFLGLDP